MDQLRALFISVVLLLRLFENESQADSMASWKSAVVKVISTPCLTQAPLFEGSGILIRVQERVFVVTSEHVLIHDSSPRICHLVSNSRFKEIRGRLIRADFFKGLGLIELSTTPELRELAVSSDKLGPPALQDPLTALGFPIGTGQLQIHEKGRMVSTESRRSLIPGATDMIEANDLLVEFGFSGGLLLSGSPPVFAGIVTHQHLRRDSGRPSEVGESGNGTERALRPGDLAFALPAKEIISWLQESLRSTTHVDWRRRADSQLNREREVCLQVLCFSLKSMSAPDLLKGDGTGGVGGDGAGVGGDHSKPDSGSQGPEILVVAPVRLDPSASSGLRGKSFEDSFLEGLRLGLLRSQEKQNSLIIPFLKSPNSDRLTELGSLERFFTLWKRDGFVPVLLKTNAEGLPQEIRKRNDLVRQITVLVQDLKDSNPDVPMKGWFSIIRDKVLLVENNLAQYEAVKALLEGENETYWGKLYEADFDAAVKLESLIQKLLAVIK
jgi:hypothetical protein